MYRLDPGLRRDDRKFFMPFSERINVLVTGGAGTVGSNLCEHLLAQEKYNVICVDNYFSGTEHNIDQLLSDPHFEFIRHDIVEPLNFEAFKGVERFRAAFVGVQEIYHLANPDSPAVYLSSPVEVLMLATAGTKNVLDLALAYRAKVLLASDTAVYGDAPSGEQISEEILTRLNYLAPGATLAQAKRTEETLGEAYRRLYSLQIKTVRLHNVYGTNMHFGDGRFIPEMIERCLDNRPITLTEDMTSAPFLFTADAVDALARLMGSEASGIYNLAHPSQFTIDEVVQTIVALTGSQSQVARGIAPADEQAFYDVWESYCRPVNVSKIKDDADWFPVVLLRDGLQQTIDYMKATRGIVDLRNR